MPSRALESIGEFADARRAARGEWLFERVMSTGSLVLRQIGGDRAGEVAVNRFLSSPEVSTGRPRSILAGHHGEVTALAFSADGLRLVTGGADTRINVWQVVEPNNPTRMAISRQPLWLLQNLWRDLASEDADFITMHIDPDLKVDSAHFGVKTLELMQGPVFWVTGRGTMQGAVATSDWQVITPREKRRRPATPMPTQAAKQ